MDPSALAAGLEAIGAGLEGRGCFPAPVPLAELPGAPERPDFTFVVGVRIFQIGLYMAADVEGCRAPPDDDLPRAGPQLEIGTYGRFQ